MPNVAHRGGCVPGVRNPSQERASEWVNGGMDKKRKRFQSASFPSVRAARRPPIGAPRHTSPVRSCTGVGAKGDKGPSSAILTTVGARALAVARSVTAIEAAARKQAASLSLSSGLEFKIDLVVAVSLGRPVLAANGESFAVAEHNRFARRGVVCRDAALPCMIACQARPLPTSAAAANTDPKRQRDKRGDTGVRQRRLRWYLSSCRLSSRQEQTAWMARVLYAHRTLVGLCNAFGKCEQNTRSASVSKCPYSKPLHI